MRCPLCGCRFREEDSKAACKGCPLARPCHMIKCPNCGYETPAETGLIKALKAWRKSYNGARRKG